MELVGQILSVVGAIALGLPILLSAVIVFLKAIPGNQGEEFLEQKVLPIVNKIRDVVANFVSPKKS